MIPEYDDNFKYDILRRSIICFFARNAERLDEFHLSPEDFKHIMTFAKDCYYAKCKLRKDSQL